MRRAVGVLVLMVLGTTLVVARCGAGADRSAEHLERGLAALAEALAGDAAAFETSDRELAGASGVVLFDAYPLFALELSRTLRDPAAMARSPVQAVLASLAAARFDEALAQAAALPRELADRDLLVRLTSDLVRLRRAPHRE